MAKPNKCPACKTVNEPNAIKCDCGYDFINKIWGSKGFNKITKGIAAIYSMFVHYLKPVEESKVAVLREGRMIEVDEVFDALMSGDLNTMILAVHIKTNPIDRHHLLNQIVKLSYKKRDETRFRTTCKRISELYLSEFTEIAPVLKKDCYGTFPRIPIFYLYPTVLTEDGYYDKAIKICETAIGYGLVDGTKTGFQGRIERIKKKIKEGVK